MPPTRRDLVVRELRADDLAFLMESAAERIGPVGPVEELATAGPEWTGLWDGVPVASGGFWALDSFSAVSWAMLARPMPYGALRPLVKVCRSLLQTMPYRWIEAWVEDGFDDALRWSMFLGFKPVERAEMLEAEGRHYRRFVFRG